MDGPTLDLLVCDRHHTTLAEMDGLPVPMRVTPDGHPIVQNLGPVMRHACEAFTTAWEEAGSERPTRQPQARQGQGLQA